MLICYEAEMYSMLLVHKMLLEDILNRKIFHSHTLGMVIELDLSSYTVNEHDGFVTFTVVKRKH